MSAAILASEWAAVASAAHQLRGSCGTLATESVRALTTVIESKAKVEDIDDIAELFAKLETELHTAQADLQQRLKTTDSDGGLQN